MTKGTAMHRVLPACIILLLILTGCDITDPLMREGVWRPNNANDANLRAMVVSPSDLARGVDSTQGDGQQAAAALDRQRQDKTRILPDSAVAKIVPIASGDTQGGH
jgi:hypothetical protein